MKTKLIIGIVLSLCLLAIPVIADCTPDWNCSLWGDCDPTDTQDCIEAEDLNMCNETYTGNYSEFGTEECDYCTPDFFCSDSSGYCHFSTKSRDCLEVTDNNSCYPQTNLTSDQFDGNFSAYAVPCGYNSTYSTTDVRNQAVDFLGGGAMEIMYWVRILVVLFTIGFLIYGVGRLGVEKIVKIMKK